MLIFHCFAALLLAVHLATSGMNDRENCSDATVADTPDEIGCIDDLLLLFSELKISQTAPVLLQREEPVERHARENEKIHAILEELKKYGIENMFKRGLSKEESMRRAKEYQGKFGELPTALIYRMLLLEKNTLRWWFVNTRGMQELAKNPARMVELENSFGELTWPEVAGLCPHINIPLKGFCDMPRKAILAFMASNIPWNDYHGISLPLDLDWATIFRSPVEPENAEAWKYLTVQVAQSIHYSGRLSYAAITSLIFNWPSNRKSLRGFLDRVFRIVYVERILGQEAPQPAALEHLKSEVRAFTNTSPPLQALIVLGKRISVRNLQTMILRPPSGLSKDFALSIYGSEPLTDTAAISTIEADLDAWNALIDYEYSYNPYCKLLLLMRHLSLFPDQVLHRRLLNMTKEGQYPLPFSLIDELATIIDSSKYKLTMGFLKDSLHLLSKVQQPLLAIKYSLGREWQYTSSLPQLILADASKLHMRQALDSLKDDYVTWIRDNAVPLPIVVLADLTPYLDVADAIKQLAQRYFLASGAILFCTSTYQRLTDFEATNRILEYLDVLFYPYGPRAFLWHSSSGGYFPAYGLDQDFMRALKFIFTRQIFLNSDILNPYKISPEYFKRFQRSTGGLVTVQDVYGDFLEEGQNIMAAPEYRQHNFEYTGVYDERIDPRSIGFIDAFHSALFDGELKGEIAND